MSQALQIGFIGAGNMASAMIGGLIDAGAASAKRVFASDPDAARLKALSDAFGIQTSADNATVAANADVLVLAVKPQMFDQVLPELAAVLRPDTLVVSIAAGIASSSIESALPAGTRVVRTMPNTPALVGAGATAVAAGTHATDEDVQLVCGLFEAVGIAVAVPESLIDAVTGLSGSGPAYVFSVVEALVAAGEAVGLSTDAATRLAGQTVYGAGKLLVESGESATTLRQRVTSPGGTTVEGLRALEERDLAGTLAAAVAAAAARSKELGRS